MIAAEMIMDFISLLLTVVGLVLSIAIIFGTVIDKIVNYIRTVIDKNVNYIRTQKDKKSLELFEKIINEVKQSLPYEYSEGPSTDDTKILNILVRDRILPIVFSYYRFDKNIRVHSPKILGHRSVELDVCTAVDEILDIVNNYMSRYTDRVPIIEQYESLLGARVKKEMHRTYDMSLEFEISDYKITLVIETTLRLVLSITIYKEFMTESELTKILSPILTEYMMR